MLKQYCSTSSIVNSIVVSSRFASHLKTAKELLKLKISHFGFALLVVPTHGVGTRFGKA